MNKIIEEQIEKIVDKYASFEQVNTRTGVKVSSAWCYDEGLLEELSNLIQKEREEAKKELFIELAQKGQLKGR